MCNSPECKMLAAVKAAVERQRVVETHFGPFEVGEIVCVNEYALTVTVTSCQDPEKIFQVKAEDYMRWTK